MLAETIWYRLEKLKTVSSGSHDIRLNAGAKEDCILTASINSHSDALFVHVIKGAIFITKTSFSGVSMQKYSLNWDDLQINPTELLKSYCFNNKVLVLI